MSHDCQKETKGVHQAVCVSYPLIEYLSFSLHHIITCIVGMNLRMAGLRHKCSGCDNKQCRHRFWEAYNAMFAGSQDGHFMLSCFYNVSCLLKHGYLIMKNV